MARTWTTLAASTQCCSELAGMVGSIDSYLAIASFALTGMIVVLIASLAFEWKYTPAGAFKVFRHKRSKVLVYGAWINLAISSALMLAVHFGRHAQVLYSYENVINFNVTLTPVCPNNATATTYSSFASFEIFDLDVNGVWPSNRATQTFPRASHPILKAAAQTENLISTKQESTAVASAAGHAASAACAADCDCPGGLCCNANVCSTRSIVLKRNY